MMYDIYQMMQSLLFKKYNRNKCGLEWGLNPRVSITNEQTHASAK